LFIFFASLSSAYANSEIEFSKIDEKLLLNPPSAGSVSDKVMIYSKVRNKTIHKAMNNQFEHIENMMFINTVYESESRNMLNEDKDCD
jgi:hypothetical protein